MAEARTNTDLVLMESEYAHVRNDKGAIQTHVGPAQITPSAQDVGVLYQRDTGRFKKCASLEEAVCKTVVTVEGFYCILLNPAKDKKQPDIGGKSSSPALDVGRKIVIPGPAMFALWPGQVADVIRGHQLKSNQYLITRVYNEEEARKNWGKAIMKPASQLTPPPSNATPEEVTAYNVALDKEKSAKMAAAPVPPDLTVGKLHIIRGTEVSFYIPPTGISVVSEGLDEAGKTQYVREALTLERLEYSILIGENGEKRYTNGPTVVFPAPTERFMEGKTDDGLVSRKFRAIELNELQGIHLKVIADYTDSVTKKSYKAGEEIFLTGKDTAIFYPREELSAIKYDGKIKNFATAIPVGEARYVLNRMTGEIKTVRGPAMLLPDPRTEVIVRRVLSDKQSGLWYPSNAEALEYNQNLRKVLAQVPTTRGAPSEGDVSRNLKGRTGQNTNFAGGGVYASSQVVATGNAIGNAFMADSSRVSKEQGFVGEEFARASNYTQPRSITLDTKFQGAPTIEVWTGWAVLVVSKDGKRRVEKGPTAFQLNYDESLEVLTFSTGKPKTTDKIHQDVYLRVDNNQVTDVFGVETSDYVQFNLRLSYKVNFEGDSSKWWSVENYVKFLCDRMRSDLKGAIKKIGFDEFRTNATETLKKLVLGTPEGRLFTENNMHVTDVEVLEVKCLDESIEGAFKQSALAVVKTNIDLAQLKRGLAVTKEREAVTREELEVRTATSMRRNELIIESADSDLKVLLAKLDNDLKSIATRKDLQESTEALKDFEFDQDLNRKKRAEDQLLAVKKVAQGLVLDAAREEAANVVSRFAAAKDGLSELAKAAMDTGAAVEIAKAMNIQRAIGGESFADAASKVLGSIPALAPLMQKLTQSPVISSNGTSEKKPSVGA
jgi:major vault protein